MRRREEVRRSTGHRPHRSRSAAPRQRRWPCRAARPCPCDSRSGCSRAGPLRASARPSPMTSPATRGPSTTADAAGPASTMPLHRQCPPFDPTVSTARLSPSSAIAMWPFGSVNASANRRFSSVASDQPFGQLEVAAAAGQPGDPPPGIEDVALDLGQRDRHRRQRAVGPADRVARVLPALVEQAARCSTLVFDEPVAIAVAPIVDPGEGGQDVRPQAVDQGVVAGPVVGLAQQHEPQRRRIDGAVVRRERQFARSGSSHPSGTRGGSCRVPRPATRRPPCAW